MATQQELIKKDAGLPATGTPQDLLRIAVEGNADLDKLERLMDLQERWEANQARKVFFDALSKFQASCPDIQKLDAAHNSKYAKLPRIVKAITPIMKDCGLSYRFEMEDAEQSIRVTCIITHKDGHSENTSMTAGADNSGSKNAIQGRASAVTYLQRYTLAGALGIVTIDADDDGNGAGTPIKAINKAQAATIRGLLKRLPTTTESKMLGVYSCTQIEDLPECVFDQVVSTLNKRIEKQSKADPVDSLL